jgi:hypothetical protein
VEIPIVAIAGVLLFLMAFGTPLYRWMLGRRARRCAAELSELVARSYLVLPCARCFEPKMQLLEVSPGARSVEYACRHCGKKARAIAGAPDSAGAARLFERFEAARERLARSHGHSEAEVQAEFETTREPLPFESTRRGRIPESLRAQVWRRDNGCCVECGSRQNLQLDHVIPVSKGGASTAANLQILCQACNLAKGARI